MTTRHRCPARVMMMLTASVLTVSACSSDGNEPARPPITRSLDASAYADTICALLPSDLSVQLGYPSAGYAAEQPQSDTGEPPSAVCHWFQPDSPMLSFYLYPSHDQLAYEYEANRNRFVGGTDEPWLEPLTIAGQPAVTLGRSHKKPNRTCEVVVGLTDSQSLRVVAGQHYRSGTGTSTGPDDGDGRACEYAMAVADAIVRRLGG